MECWRVERSPDSGEVVSEELPAAYKATPVIAAEDAVKVAASGLPILAEEVVVLPAMAVVEGHPGSDSTDTEVDCTGSWWPSQKDARHVTHG